MPGVAWPCGVLDDQTVEDIIACLEVQSRAGFNEFDIFGLFATTAWSPDVRSTVGSERRGRVNRILTAAHDLNIDVLCGLGVYSWGFDKIIAQDPRVRRGSAPSVMCACEPAAWDWMKEVIHYILDEFDVDGFHLESADQGRCDCPACSKQGDVEYHCRVTQRAAEYIRAHWPDAVLLVNMCGFMRPLRKVKDEELPYLAELSRHIDTLIDPGHFGCFIDEASRRRVVQRLHCSFGTCGGIWVYPPQGWDRLRWFLPHTAQSARHFKRLYDEGCRATEYYAGPTINPGVEVNIACGGRIMTNVDRNGNEILAEVIESLYKPSTTSTRDRLVDVFLRAESAYFDNWNPQPVGPEEAPGELTLEPLAGIDPPGPAVYLSSDHRGTLMDATGRAAYKRELLGILDEIPAVKGNVDDGGRTERIETCIRNVVSDIESFG